MLLSDGDILQLKKKGEIGIKPFVRKRLWPVGYDLRLDQKIGFVRIGDATHVDVKSEFHVTQTMDVGRNGYVSIRPGELVLCSSVERISLGKSVAASVVGRSSLNRIGVQVINASEWISPGFEGKVTIVLNNHFGLPVKIYVGMRVARLSFYRVSSEVMEAYGEKFKRYQDQDEPRASRIWEDFG